MKLLEVYKLLEDNKPTYQGPALEKGATSISGKGKPAPGMEYLISHGIFKKGMKVLDYGAGKYARNSKFLQQHGIDSVAVDPFNHNEKSGVLPDEAVAGKHFDVAFTSYVLNVVPEKIEDEILSKLDKLADSQCHITRGVDLVEFLAASQDRKGFTYKWIQENVKGLNAEVKRFLQGQASKEDLIKLAEFGFATPRGFQRLPGLERKGYSLVRMGANRIYTIR
jgi:hypothetical protein